MSNEQQKYSDEQEQQLQLCREVRQKIVANLLKDGILEQTSNGIELQKLLEQELLANKKQEQERAQEQVQEQLIEQEQPQVQVNPQLKTAEQLKVQEQQKAQKQSKTTEQQKEKAEKKDKKEKERNPILELFFPMKDRGANVLVEPDEKSIAAGKGKHYAKTGQHRRNAFSLILEAVVVIVLVMLLFIPLRAFVLQYYYIPSGSMLETLQIDDHVLSEKVSYYFSSPKRGDIVTFDGTKFEEGKVLIKRVIGVGGDVIDIHNGYVYLNGEKLDEPYTLGKQTNELSNSENITYPYTVPDGQLWVMGDNRTNSTDSRVFGPIPVENVTGHAFWRYWPLNRFGSL